MDLPLESAVLLIQVRVMDTERSVFRALPWVFKTLLKRGGGEGGERCLSNDFCGKQIKPAILAGYAHYTYKNGFVTVANV